NSSRFKDKVIHQSPIPSPQSPNLLQLLMFYPSPVTPCLGRLIFNTQNALFCLLHRLKAKTLAF
ncbi:MAG: hypothetical protein C4322_23345, partial [Mastigocladus sp. ERB_26_1]